MSNEPKSVVLVAASHDEEILNANLRPSLLQQKDKVELHVVKNAVSASIAYNQALSATQADIIVFVHHDVFLPAGWIELLHLRIAEVEALDPDWALIGPAGVGPGGPVYGPVWSTSLGQIAGQIPMEPTPVHSFDELMIVMRREAGLRFDEDLPNYHLYGTDIVQSALAQGKGCYTVSLPLVHNDGFHDALGDDFTEAFRFIQKKWRAKLPIKTAVTLITSSGIKHWRQLRQARKYRDHRLAMALPTQTDPQTYAEICGWHDLTPKRNER
jgi:glycosyltransferase involved in cell wall biosynthesis